MSSPTVVRSSSKNCFVASMACSAATAWSLAAKREISLYLIFSIIFGIHSLITKETMHFTKTALLGTTPILQLYKSALKLTLEYVNLEKMNVNMPLTSHGKLRKNVKDKKD